MSLSPDDFQQIRARLEAIRAAGAALETSERRRSPRVKYSAKLTICRESELHFSRPITVALHDISESGLGVIYDTRLKKGDRFIISIEYPGRERICVSCSVVRCQWWAERAYLVGLRMLAIVDELGRKRNRNDWLISGE